MRMICFLLPLYGRELFCIKGQIEPIVSYLPIYPPIELFLKFFSHPVNDVEKLKVTEE